MCNLTSHQCAEINWKLREPFMGVGEIWTRFISINLLRVNPVHSTQRPTFDWCSSCLLSSPNIHFFWILEWDESRLITICNIIHMTDKRILFRSDESLKLKMYSFVWQKFDAWINKRGNEAGWFCIIYHVNILVEKGIKRIRWRVAWRTYLLIERIEFTLFKQAEEKRIRLHLTQRHRRAPQTFTIRLPRNREWKCIVTKAWESIYFKDAK